MCDDASDGVCATGAFLLGGFSGGMGGFVGMILNHPAFGVFGGVTLGVLAGAYPNGPPRAVLRDRRRARGAGGLRELRDRKDARRRRAVRLRHLHPVREPGPFATGLAAHRRRLEVEWLARGRRSKQPYAPWAPPLADRPPLPSPSHVLPLPLAGPGHSAELIQEPRNIEETLHTADRVAYSSTSSIDEPGTLIAFTFSALSLILPITSLPTPACVDEPCLLLLVVVVFNATIL